MGPAGAGQLTKMVNQICIAGIAAGPGRGAWTSRSAPGSTSRQVVDVHRQGRGAELADGQPGAARWPRGEFEFGFAVEWMRKDLGICLDEARPQRRPPAVTALVDQFYAQRQARGGTRWDTSSLVHLLQQP